MRQDIYSNKEFIELRERLNKEILRRAGFKWFDPLATPKVGEDKSSPLSFPESDVDRTYVDDLTYTINNPSEGSIERTRNIHYPKNGENPAGCPDEYISNEPIPPYPSTSFATILVHCPIISANFSKVMSWGTHHLRFRYSSQCALNNALLST